MEDESVVVNKEEEMVDLPPGFRFHPTDEEIITHYLTPKVVNTTFISTAIGEVDLNKCEPWDLPKRAKMGEKECYFFCHRDRKYPTGTRTNRATESGYWKATGKDKQIFKAQGCLVGMKKTLVFYRGRAPKGDNTNWVIHEFSLHPKFSYYNHLPKDDWVVCRVFHKSKMKAASNLMDSLFNSCSSSPPPLVDPARPSSSFNEEDDDIRKYNYYDPSLHHHHHQPFIYNNTYNNNAYQMIMNQFSSCPNHDSTTVITRSQNTGLTTDLNNNNTRDISSSKLHNDNNNIGISGEIPDVADDIDCLWDF